jgi:hypothetical protein
VRRLRLSNAGRRNIDHAVVWPVFQPGPPRAVVAHFEQIPYTSVILNDFSREEPALSEAEGISRVTGTIGAPMCITASR